MNAIQELRMEHDAVKLTLKMLIKKDIGNITLFAFDAGQGLSEHTAPFDAVVLHFGWTG